MGTIRTGTQTDPAQRGNAEQASLAEKNTSCNQAQPVNLVRIYRESLLDHNGDGKMVHYGPSYSRQKDGFGSSGYNPNYNWNGTMWHFMIMTSFENHSDP